MPDNTYIIKKYVGKLVFDGGPVTLVSGWNNFDAELTVLNPTPGNYTIVSDGELTMGNTYIFPQVIRSSSGATYIAQVDHQDSSTLFLQTARTSTENLEDFEELHFDITVYPTLP